MARFATLTNPGRRPGLNEDAVGSIPGRDLWFVADGVGGAVAGGIASGIVAKILHAPGGQDELEGMLLRAHDAIVEYAKAHPECIGMGSTVVAAQLVNSRCRIVWVGDSRAYLWRRGRLRCLTKDHSFVEMVKQEQHLTDTEAADLPDRNLVLQSLGYDTPVPSVVNRKLRGGDWVILCSDGLNDELTDAKIAGVLRAAREPADAAQALIDAALDHGGKDNVSVAIMDYGNAGLLSRVRLGPNMRMLLAILGGAAAALATLAAWWYWIQRH